LHFATFFVGFLVFADPTGVVVTLGVGVSVWLMGGVKDTPSPGPLGEAVCEPDEVVDEPPEEVVGGPLAVVKVCVSPKASCHLFMARRR
jgi:hypothetical protein